jgi:hypothetical protein
VYYAELAAAARAGGQFADLIVWVDAFNEIKIIAFASGAGERVFRCQIRANAHCHDTNGSPSSSWFNNFMTSYQENMLADAIEAGVTVGWNHRPSE